MWRNAAVGLQIEPSGSTIYTQFKEPIRAKVEGRVSTRGLVE
jgi:hypothetical protein